MILYILFWYLVIIGFNYIKIHILDGFNAISGKWKWWYNLPNVKLDKNQVVDENMYKKYLFNIIFMILSLYFVLIVTYELIFKLNVTAFIILTTMMIIDLTYFLHIKSKEKFKKNIL
jgi:hypothetical protein